MKDIINGALGMILGTAVLFIISVLWKNRRNIIKWCVTKCKNIKANIGNWLCFRERLKKRYELEINKLNIAHQIQIEELEVAHQSEIEELKTAHRDEIKKIKDRKMDEYYGSILRNFKATIPDMSAIQQYSRKMQEIIETIRYPRI